MTKIATVIRRKFKYGGKDGTTMGVDSHSIHRNFASCVGMGAAGPPLISTPCGFVWLLEQKGAYGGVLGAAGSSLGLQWRFSLKVQRRESPDGAWSAPHQHHIAQLPSRVPPRAACVFSSGHVYIGVSMQFLSLPMSADADRQQVFLDTTFAS